MNRAQHIEQNIVTLYETVTLQFHTTLNPKLWNLPEETLKPEVRAHLLKIAELWRDFAKIPVKSVVDIIMLGGNSAFNYTRFSDIDLHLVIHRKDLGKEPDLIEEYILTKKNLWAKEHEPLTIYGFPVEIYAEDVKTKHPVGQGSYSVKHNKWLVKPQKTPVDFNDPHLIMKVDHYKSRIDHMIEHNVPDAAFDRLKDKFKNMRKSSLQAGGEFAFENNIFKELRNQGYLDKVNDYLHHRQDTKLSLFLKKKKNVTK